MLQNIHRKQILKKHCFLQTCTGPVMNSRLTIIVLKKNTVILGVLKSLILDQGPLFYPTSKGWAAFSLSA